VSAKTDEIIKQAAEPIFKTIEVQSEASIQKDLASTVTEKMPQAASEKTVTETVPVIVKMASVEPKHSGLKPMRLRMSPYFTTAQLNAFTEERKRLVETQRPLSAKMQQAMQSIIDRCAKSPGPVYFQMPILDGDADMGQGDFDIECTPGTIATQKRTSAKDLAYAWLASDDIRLERRQSNMGWKMRFALMDEYVLKTQNGSISKDRTECVRIEKLIKEKYSFTEMAKTGQDRMIKNCAEKDYNWIRRRNNIPEVQ